MCSMTANDERHEKFPWSKVNQKHLTSCGGEWIL